MSRLDARAKASGEACYVDDVVLPGMLHAAAVRSPVPHGRIVRVDTAAAAAADGVVGVYTAADVATETYGRRVRDAPILAREKVRFVGERVAVVVADRRVAAERAVGLVDVDYDVLPAVTRPEEAVAADAPLVHDTPWDYPGAAVTAGDGPNLQSRVVVGSRADAEAALREARFVVDRTYVTPAGHQGYLEPQGCVAAVETSGRVRVWTTNKSPYRMRQQVADCLGLDPELIDVQPVVLGGDFGGKGSPGEAALCAELSRLTGRPVKLVLRYWDDLATTDTRHPARIRVRAGCDGEGRLVGLSIEALLDGGAYAAIKPLANVNLHGISDAALAYRVPALFLESRIAYTNNVPKGHMRAPGAPQAAFAVESALDELAAEAGIDPADVRRRNLVRSGQPHVDGEVWVEDRGVETLDAALDAALAAVRGRDVGPPGRVTGRGVAVYARRTPSRGTTSLRLVPRAGGGVRVEVPMPETGTGSHTVVRQRLAAELGLDTPEVEVVQVPTSELPFDQGVGGSRVTALVSGAAIQAARAWKDRGDDEPIVVTYEPSGRPVGSYCVQVAKVAVDTETGQVDVLEVLSAVDVAEIVNPQAHQMQIDGGAAMGYGFACLEDLDVSDGQVWAANLGDFRLPAAEDMPALRTVLVPGGKGAGGTNVKAIGELTNVPTAAAIANAVADATGCRIRTLPVTADRVYAAMRERGRPCG